ncbi:hypothetical protein [Methylobacterium pseudosasicola]|uniref:Uncharacterized protein n=1 Tax=Methylobacterium pseudosasicola TaxID=582667 RepID=A0A1I4SV88_9HYPH|nr:hypothetical protein [Methylobacterium pseudosasicola]SFM68203.1 hypothetical protein SAMN05192568_10462 [Methylobacterium pseudosasicola]
MKTLFAVAILCGSTIGAMAADSYSDYRTYFDEKPVSSDRTKLKPSKKNTIPSRTSMRGVLTMAMPPRTPTI